MENVIHICVSIQTVSNISISSLGTLISYCIEFFIFEIGIELIFKPVDVDSTFLSPKYKSLTTNV